MIFKYNQGSDIFNSFQTNNIIEFKLYNNLNV